MKFYINAGKLIDGLLPAYCLSIKKIVKGWYWTEKITIDSYAEGVSALAYQKDTFVKTDISEDTYYGLGYLSMEKGFTTVNSFDLMDALNSFSPSDSIIVCDSGNELKLTNASDEEEFQTVLTFDDHIEDPVIASKFTNELTIDRKLFVKGIKKVSFAMDQSETQAYYMCLMFKASGNAARFAAGSGARFVAYDIEGIKLTADPMTIIFPMYTIPVLSSILSKNNADEVLIKQTEIVSDSTNQVVIAFGGTQIVIPNLDTSINYPPLNMFIGHTYPYKISVKASDLKKAVSGALATLTKEIRKENDVHKITVTADLAKGFFTFISETKTSASRKVHFSGNTFVVDESFDIKHCPYFQCNSTYLDNVITIVNKDDELTFSFEDSSQAEEDKSTRPVLVEFPSVINKSDNTKEMFYMIIAVAIKKKG